MNWAQYPLYYEMQMVQLEHNVTKNQEGCRVIVLLQVDVVILADQHRHHFGVLVGVRWQGLECWRIELGKHGCAATGQLLEGFLIEPGQ